MCVRGIFAKIYVLIFVPDVPFFERLTRIRHGGGDVAVSAARGMSLMVPRTRRPPCTLYSLDTKKRTFATNSRRPPTYPFNGPCKVKTPGLTTQSCSHIYRDFRGRFVWSDRLQGWSLVITVREIVINMYI